MFRFAFHIGSMKLHQLAPGNKWPESAYNCESSSQDLGWRSRGCATDLKNKNIELIQRSRTSSSGMISVDLTVHAKLMQLQLAVMLIRWNHHRNHMVLSKNTVAITKRAFSNVDKFNWREWWSAMEFRGHFAIHSPRNRTDCYPWDEFFNDPSWSILWV